MLVAGAGALYLASYFGSDKGSYNYEAWQMSYAIMAGVMLVGVATTLIISEPTVQRADNTVYSASDYLRFFLLFLVAVAGFIATFYYSADIAKSLKGTFTELFSNKRLASFLVSTIRLVSALAIVAVLATILVKLGAVNKKMATETYVTPVKDFFTRYGMGLAFLLLALIGLYRISDIVLGVISNVFYQDLGFSKNEIATVVKSFGLWMTIAGGFLGGLLSVRFGVMKILFLGAVLSAATNLMFMWLAQTGYNMPLLYAVISADNLSAGLASAAFIAFLSSLTNIKFTAIQYAIFSSLMTLLPKIIGGYSGTMVDDMGYSSFFLVTAVMGIPVLVLILIASKHFDQKAAS